MSLFAHLQTLVISFFFNYTPTTEIYTLPLHDALPISPPCSRTLPPSPTAPRTGRRGACGSACRSACGARTSRGGTRRRKTDRKRTRLNSSHANISYGVLCLKKKKELTRGVIGIGGSGV